MSEFYGLIPLLEELKGEEKAKASAKAELSAKRKERISEIFTAVESLNYEAQNTMLRFEISKRKLPIGWVFLFETYGRSTYVFLEELLEEVQKYTSPKYKDTIMEVATGKLEKKYLKSHI